MEYDEDEDLGNTRSNPGAKKAKKSEPKTPLKNPKTPKKVNTPQKTMPTKTPQKSMPTKTPQKSMPSKTPLKNTAQPVKPAPKTMGKSNHYFKVLKAFSFSFGGYTYKKTNMTLEIAQ